MAGHIQQDGAIVRMVNLHKSYKLGKIDLHVLKGIDLSIGHGEYVAIMGPSGSGKSTLLNIIGCLDKPSGGSYILGEDDVAMLDDDDLSRIRGLRIGFIFQSFNLIRQLNVIENIAVPMYYQQVPEGESFDRARELAEKVGLGDRTGHRPFELSGGQQQRVAIARSLANDPLIILADEPTGNLDSHSGGEIMNILDELNGQGKTIIMVTHDQKLSGRAKRTINVLDGRIERDEVLGCDGGSVL